MAIVRHELQSCCGKRTLLLETSAPIKREYVKKFTDEGFIAPLHFATAGLFYVEREPIIASGAFGSNKINVRCSNSKNCIDAINIFEQLLDKVTLEGQ